MICNSSLDTVAELLKNCFQTFLTIISLRIKCVSEIKASWNDTLVYFSIPSYVIKKTS